MNIYRGIELIPYEDVNLVAAGCDVQVSEFDNIQILPPEKLDIIGVVSVSSKKGGSMKIVYEGMEFKVPKGTRYVAADDDGKVHTYGKAQELTYEDGQYKGDYLGFVGHLPPEVDGRRYLAVAVTRMIIVTPITNI